MIAETYNYNKVRHADVSVPPGTEPLPYAFLDPFFGRFGKTSRRDVLRILENGAASIPNGTQVAPRNAHTDRKLQDEAKYGADCAATTGDP